MCLSKSLGIRPIYFAFSIGSDTGDSIRKPAAYCGIVGYKPTYGMISRYGLFAFASSLDHCGVLTRSVKDAAIVVDGMKGIDQNDMTTWDSSKIHLNDDLSDDVKGKKLFYIKELCNIENYPNVHASCDAEEWIKIIENFLAKKFSITKNKSNYEEIIN